MMCFYFLGYKVEVKAVEVVGLFAVGRYPAAEAATLAIVQQDVTAVAPRAWCDSSDVAPKQVNLCVLLLVARAGHHRLQAIHLPDVPRDNFGNPQQ